MKRTLALALALFASSTFSATPVKPSGSGVKPVLPAKPAGNPTSGNPNPGGGNSGGRPTGGGSQSGGGFGPAAKVEIPSGRGTGSGAGYGRNGQALQRPTNPVGGGGGKLTDKPKQPD